jgi:protein translocase SecG subunit
VGIFLGIVFAVLALLMVCAILLQEGKGGGLAAMGGAATDSVMGARNPLRRFTAYCFAAFVLVVLGMNYVKNRQANVEINAGLALPAAPTPEQILPPEPELPKDKAIPPVSATATTTTSTVTPAPEPAANIPAAASATTQTSATTATASGESN